MVIIIWCPASPSRITVLLLKTQSLIAIKSRKRKKERWKLGIKGNKSRSQSHDWPKKAPKSSDVLQHFFAELNESMNMKLLLSERTSTRCGNSLLIIGFKVWYVFNYSWKFVVIIVIKAVRSHRGNCGGSNERCCNRFVRTTLTTEPACAFFFNGTEDRINILTWTIISMQLTEKRLRWWRT